MNRMMSENELKFIAAIWTAFFPNDIFHPSDKRIGGIASFKSYILSSGKHLLSDPNQIIMKGTVELDLIELSDIMPFNDFIPTLRTQPNEVLGCLGLAISCVIAFHIAKRKQSHIASNISAYTIRPQIINLYPRTPYCDLKSNMSGQLVSLTGYVIRVAAPQPYVTVGSFRCPKCGNIVRKPFQDGIMSPPTQCSNSKCRSRYLDFQHSLAVTSDFQRVKLQEIESEPLGYDGDASTNSQSVSDAARVPRMFELELRGDVLVDSCVAGDAVVAVGIVKAVQADEMSSRRGRDRAESGIHQLYLDVISIKPLRGPGEYGRKRIHSDRNHDTGDSEQVSSTEKSEKIPRIQHSEFSSSDLKNIRQLALSRHCLALLVSSLCPGIYGHELVKLGILLGLFGGTGYEQTSGSRGVGLARSRNASVATGDDNDSKSFRRRSDIHVLLVGDPGLGLYRDQSFFA
mmetsp:Transcript_16885/g.25435  ORF Transcript_16885/g.25435 Transcript_16885/m.25435 type:complete len:458 (-) Transcript_16885:1453-2826(-)